MTQPFLGSSSEHCINSFAVIGRLAVPLVPCYTADRGAYVRDHDHGLYGDLDVHILRPFWCYADHQSLSVEDHCGDRDRLYGCGCAEFGRYS